MEMTQILGLLEDARDNLDASYQAQADFIEMPKLYVLQSIAGSLHVIAQMMLTPRMDEIRPKLEEMYLMMEGGDISEAFTLLDKILDEKD
jgi:hypothetical protein